MATACQAVSGAWVESAEDAGALLQELRITWCMQLKGVRPANVYLTKTQVTWATRKASVSELRKPTGYTL